MENMLRRNTSNAIVKKHVPHAHLHKKTYFNALEKMMISPRNLHRNDSNNLIKSIDASAEQAFREVFKSPPSRFGEETQSKAVHKGSKTL